MAQSSLCALSTALEVCGLNGARSRTCDCGLGLQSPKPTATMVGKGAKGMLVSTGTRLQGAGGHEHCPLWGLLPDACRMAGKPRRLRGAQVWHCQGSCMLRLSQALVGSPSPGWLVGTAAPNPPVRSRADSAMEPVRRQEAHFQSFHQRHPGEGCGSSCWEDSKTIGLSWGWDTATPTRPRSSLCALPPTGSV